MSTITDSKIFEESLIGSIFVKPDITISQLNGLQPSHFEDQELATIFGLVKTLLAEGKTVDGPLLINEIRKRKLSIKSDRIGELFNKVPHDKHLPHYINEVEQAGIRRQSALLLETAIKQLAEPGSDVDDVLVHVKTKLASIRVINDVDAVDIESLTQSYPKLRVPVIDGILRTGETLNVIASPKIGKSFLVAGLAWSIVTGRRWLGLDVVEGEVLIIDNELHKNTLVNRYQRIADAMEIPHSDRERLNVISLRGKNFDIDRLSELDIPKGKYKLIVLDALYRFIPKGTNENDNAAMMQLYNRIDELAELWGCAIAIIHHSTKGDQSSKGVTDVGAGAGSIARAADSHLIVRPHEEPGHFVLEAVTRSFKAPDPLSIRFEYPLWESTTLKPSTTRKTASEVRQAKVDIETRGQIIKALGVKRMTKSQLRSDTGFGEQRVTRGLTLLIESQNVQRRKVRRSGKVIDIYRVAQGIPEVNQ